MRGHVAEIELDFRRAGVEVGGKNDVDAAELSQGHVGPPNLSRKFNHRQELLGRGQVRSRASRLSRRALFLLLLPITDQCGNGLGLLLGGFDGGINGHGPPEFLQGFLQATGFPETPALVEVGHGRLKTGPLEIESVLGVSGVRTEGFFVAFARRRHGF